MNHRETNFEENLERLLKASCGPKVEVSPAGRERLRAELAFMPHRRPEPADFSESALGFLTVLVLLPLAACAAGTWCGPVGLAGFVLNSPLLALVLVNLIGTPLASLMIILRRKYA